MSDELAGHRVLLVVDSADDRRVLARSLLRNGLEVTEAATGSQALALAATLPDAIVLDVRLPDMSGVEVTRHLRDDPATRTIPILHRSSVAVAEEEQLEGLASGADAYLTEPISEQMLLAVLASLLRFGRLQRQLETALSANVSGIFDINLGTGAVRWSDSLERMYHLPPGAFRGTTEHVAELTHPDDRERVLAAARSGDDSISLSYRILRASGTIGWIEARGTVFRDADGNPSRVQGIAIDVTEREQERRRLAQLRRLAELLSGTTRATDVLDVGIRAVRALDLELVGPLPADAVPDDHIAVVAIGDDRLAAVARDDVTVVDAELALVIVQQVAIAYDRARRYDAEVANAAALHRALVPEDTPVVDGWLIDSFYATATEVERLGGDFYDVIERDGFVIAVVGDVAGHGLDATRQMSITRTLVRTCMVEFGPSPAKVLTEANRLMAPVCGDGMPFVTVVVATVDLATGAMRAATAGHPAPIVGRGGDAAPLDLEVGPPLGVVPDPSYVDTSAELGVDDWFAVFTDGVFERRDEFLDESIAVVAGELPSRPTARAIADIAERHAESARPTEDDRAIILVRRLPADG